jgi:hypothetical protein
VLATIKCQVEDLWALTMPWDMLLEVEEKVLEGYQMYLFNFYLVKNILIISKTRKTLSMPGGMLGFQIYGDISPIILQLRVHSADQHQVHKIGCIPCSVSHTFHSQNCIFIWLLRTTHFYQLKLTITDFLT